MLCGRGLSSFASQMQAVALGWQVYALTGRAFSLGLLGLAQFLPVVLLVFVAGHAVDRGDRRLIAAVCQGCESAIALLLAMASVAHVLTPGMIYGLVAAAACARAFEGPSAQALLPGLVPAAVFPRAAAVSSSVFQPVSIVGPAGGGLLYGLGPSVAYGTCAGAFLLASIAMALVPARRPAPDREPATLASVFGGLTFIRQRPDILGALSLDLFAVLFGGATALLPIYARLLHVGPVGLGLLRAAPAVGALGVALILARHPMHRHLGRRMFAAVGLFGLGTIVFGASRWLPLSVAALALLGGADVVSVVIRSTLVQTRTPDEMRGRVAAVNLLFIGSSNELGEFESGSLASLVGVVPAVVLGGLGTLAVAALWIGLFPALWRLDRLDAG